MKTDATFKRAFNDALDMIRLMPSGSELASENKLSESLLVSRTTVRKVLKEFTDLRLIVVTDRKRLRTSQPVNADKFPSSETIAISAQVETQFLQWMLRDDARPGTAINELDLARQFGVATTVVREFLNRFQRFGLIERRIGSGWEFRGFTPGFARELFEIREMFEMRSARAFAHLPDSSPLWSHLGDLRARHVNLRANIDTDFHSFSDLDSAFHRLINSVIPNRFIDSFYDIITMIFHYHYQWNKQDERQRNEVAVGEHLVYIDALIARDVKQVERACAGHLRSARETLMNSIDR
ncbi:MAG: GntR family transcriptional regulator [Deltaproteobacteria bacterium]